MFPDIDTAWSAALDNIGLNGEVIMVVGCGQNPHTHPGVPHRLQNGRNDGTTIDFQLHQCYTMDITHAQNPSRVGSFWVEDHTEDLPPNQFNIIFLENLPDHIHMGNLFAVGRVNAAVRTAWRLLLPNGFFIVRSPAINGITLPAACMNIFGNSQLKQDQYGMATHLIARK